MTGQSRHIENTTFQGFEVFTVATLGYLFLGLAITSFSKSVERRLGAAT